MKIALNKTYTEYKNPKAICELLKVHKYDDSTRTNPLLIQWIENNSYKSGLLIAEIPDNTSDYEIDDTDGYEQLTYVVDGKIHHA